MAIKRKKLVKIFWIVISFFVIISMLAWVVAI